MEPTAPLDARFRPVNRSVAGAAGLSILFAAAGCAGSRRPAAPPSTPTPADAGRGVPLTASDLGIAPDVRDRLRQLPRTRLDYDRTLLSAEEQRTLALVIEAARRIDEIFLRQVDEANPALRETLAPVVRQQVPLALEALEYFDANYGPWDRLKANEPFVGSRPKPKGAAFYPADMSAPEFESWIAAHPADRDAFHGLFTVIRRKGEGLVAIPYSRYYAPSLAAAAAKLKEAAASTTNASLKKYLDSRAAAFLSDDYFASDVAWMDLDSPLEVTIGPYEVYEDALFNYKAAFEAFVMVRDREESERLSVYAGHLPEMERNLPIPEEHKNFNRKFESPIVVVQEVYTAGDARQGVQTSAFNLPNDERVREAKGSKKVLAKNVMQAKFDQSGRLVAERTLEAGELRSVAFDPYFAHTLFHELSHGLGPGIITGPDGKKVESRLLLKNLYSTIEECKADVVGMWNVVLAIDQKWITSFDENSLYATVAGLAFRSMRFGLDEAHGGGTAVQWNWFREKGGVVPGTGGRFRVRSPKMREAVRTLATELLEIEATGDYARAQRLLERYGRETPEIRATIGKLSDIPVDIRPVFVAAGES